MVMMLEKKNISSCGAWGALELVRYRQKAEISTRWLHMLAHPWMWAPLHITLFSGPDIYIATSPKVSNFQVEVHLSYYVSKQAEQQHGNLYAFAKINSLKAILCPSTGFCKPHFGIQAEILVHLHIRV